MSLLIKKIDKSEINHSLLELRRKMDRAVYKNQSVRLMLTQNTAFLTSAFTRVSNWIYRLEYYQNILDNAVGAINKQRDRLETTLSTLQGELASLRQQRSTAQARLNEINSQLSAAKKARDDAEKIYNQAVTDYNNWISSYYNPTKASLESDLTAANQTLSEERAELTRLRNLYNEKIAAKATAQSVLDTVKNRLSSLPTETYSQQNVYISPSLSVTFEYAGSTYTVPAVSGSYRIRFRQYSAGVMNLNQHFKVAYGYIDSSATWQEETSIYDVSGISAWVSVIYPAALGWKNAYLAAYQSTVDSLQDDIDELYDEISNQEEVVYDAEDAVEYIEGELRDLEDEKDEYYDDNVQSKYDDWQEKANIVVGLEAEQAQINNTIISLESQISAKQLEVKIAQDKLDEFNKLHPPTEDGNDDETKSTDNDWRS